MYPWPTPAKEIMINDKGQIYEELATLKQLNDNVFIIKYFDS